VEDERKLKPSEVDEKALAPLEPTPSIPLVDEDTPKPSRVSRFWFTVLLLFVFGVPALATWPVVRQIPVTWLLMTIIMLGLIWVLALVLFGEYMSRGESAPISTEVMIIAAAFFLLIAILGMGPLRKVGYLWVAGLVVTAGAVIRLYREPTNPRHPLMLFASLALMLVAWLLMYLSRLDYFIGIPLVIILAIYWLLMAPPRATGRGARRGPSL